MDTVGVGFVLLAIIGILGLLLYFAPTIIAGSRDAKHGVAIFALNLLLGWTFVGWAAALVWAAADDKR